MAAFTIREAIFDDAAGIAQVHVSSWQHAYADLLPKPYIQKHSVTKRERFWYQFLSSDKNWPVMVAEKNNRIVGFASMIPARDDDLNDAVVAELGCIYLLETETRQGIGIQLMRRCWQDALARGFSQTSLWVFENNNPARTFYEKLGYGVVGEAKHIRELGVAEVRMMAKLSLESIEVIR